MQGVFIFLACVTACFGDVIYDEPSECGVIRRKDWSTILKPETEELSSPVGKVVVLDTVTKRCANREECSDQMRALQRYHIIALGYSDIALSFYVSYNGDVYEGRGWRTGSAHARRRCRSALAIGFMGNYMYKNPSMKSIKAIRELLKCGTDAGYLSRNYHLTAHRDVMASLSPGDKLYNEIKAWPRYNASIGC